ncbi:hypothetical protein KR200_000424 [Drosophila serrata]|nr:hypothetical protein KR200_000424 [Drosophila serrata]
MKTIVLIAAICLVVFSCWLDVSQAQSANASTSDAGIPKRVTVSNLQYTVVRRISVGNATTSSTSSRSSGTSSRIKTNRNLRAKIKQAAKRTAARRTRNSRRVRR